MNHRAGQVLCGTQGSRLGQCHVRHIGPSNTNEIPNPLSEWPDLRGFNELQATRATWLAGDAIEKAMMSYRASLPRHVQDRIHIADTSIPDLFHTHDRQYRVLLQGSYRRFLRPFTQFEYTLWPCNWGGNHWQLAVIHKGKSNPEAAGWDRVLQVAVIDGWRDAGQRVRYQTITTRLRGILEKAGLTIADNCERIVWSPWQRDNWSCGLRTFRAAKQFMDRIADNITSNRGHDEQLWDSLSGWFNPDQTRWEMIGLNAHEAIKAMDYRARIAVELTSQIHDEDGLQDAGDVMRPPAVSQNQGDQSEVPPQPAERRIVPIATPNERRIAPSWPVEEGDTSIPRRGGNDDTLWARREAQPPKESVSRKRRVRSNDDLAFFRRKGPGFQKKQA